MLFLSRAVDGFLGGNIALAQAYITDVTDEESRARGLGLSGAAFGLGFMIGPALGGALSAGGDFAVPAFVAAGLSTVNLVGVLVWLPESLPAASRAKRGVDRRDAFTIQALFAALGRPCVGPLLIVSLFFGLAFTIFQTIFSLFVDKQLGLGPEATGYLLTYAGVVIVAVQGGGIALLTRRFTDKQLVFGGSVLHTLSLLAWAFTPTVGWLLMVLAPIALSGGVLGVVTNSALTKCVLPEEVGGTLGIAASWGSLVRVIAPVAGGFLLGRFGSAAPGLLGVALMIWLVPFIWRRVLLVSDPKCPAPV
jgi:DHA1 family tetracycline resistance protein-like MFS transporter